MYIICSTIKTDFRFDNSCFYLFRIITTTTSTCLSNTNQLFFNMEKRYDRFEVLTELKLKFKYF